MTWSMKGRTSSSKLGSTSTFMYSTLRRFSRCFITVDSVPSYLPSGWPPKHGLKAISRSGGVRKPYQIRSDGAGGKLAVSVPRIE